MVSEFLGSGKVTGAKLKWETPADRLEGKTVGCGKKYEFCLCMFFFGVFLLLIFFVF